MAYTIRRGAVSRTYADLRTLLATASAKKSGDELAGIAAESDEERALARLCLAEVPLRAFLEDLVVPYETDEVTRLVIDGHDPARFEPVSGMTVGEFREFLLAPTTTTESLAHLAPGVTPEMAAAVSKLMKNQDLVVVAKKCVVETRFRTTLGQPGRLAARLQPNHPTDAPGAILAATLDGLLYGMGDAVVGVNPARDSVEGIVTLSAMFDELRGRLDAPWQSCILGHLTTTLRAIEKGAPVDLLFQSIAGTEKANRGFGIDLALLREAESAGASLGRGGPNVLYFETGQGSALSADAAFGVDQQTLEARAYGVARAFAPLLVNTVVGFIGPEYLYDGKQITRAGLEDHFCGKLLGVPMGVDVCYTNHAEADQDDMDDLAFLLTSAGVNFLIAVPGADDVMLGYQSLSHHDVATLRAHFGLRPAPEFEAWLERQGLFEGGRLIDAQDATRRLLARGGQG